MIDEAQSVHRPLVTVKYAQTLDGRIATSIGHSQWVSGLEARTFAHRLRAENDAVLVGVGTLLADNPALTVRLVEGANPLRVIVDSKLRTPPEAAVFAQPGSTLVATSRPAVAEHAEALRHAGAAIVELPSRDGQIDPAALLGELGHRGVRSVLVEGGAGIVTSLLRLRLVHRLVVILAPKIVGTGLEAIGDLGIRRMDQAVTIDDRSVMTLGPDLAVMGRPVWPEDIQTRATGVVRSVGTEGESA